MRRENRRKNLQNNDAKVDKLILYSGIGVAILAVIVFCLFMYSKSLSDDMKNSTMNLEEMANITNNTQNTQSASTEIGKTVEESKNEIQKPEENTTNNSTNNTTNNTSNINNSNNTSNQTKDNTTKTTNTTKANNTANVASNTKANAEKETKKELSFAKPVEGEVVREYAKDNLIYSETLKEWTTHMGIDIKADKTTVVKAAEAGKVKTIKNDPR